MIFFFFLWIVFNSDLFVYDSKIIAVTGWLKTVDGYYSSEVSRIINGVLASLKANPSRTFTWATTWAQGHLILEVHSPRPPYSEFTLFLFHIFILYLQWFLHPPPPPRIYLERWWGSASETQKQTMKDLIANGQFELVSGGGVRGVCFLMYNGLV